MGILEVLLSGVGLSMDAFAVALSTAVCMKGKLRVWHVVKVALFFGLFQALMPTIGYYLGRFFAGYVESISAWVAFVLLAVIGGKMLVEAIWHGPESDARSTDNPVDTKVLAVLAIATSIDALAVGISFAFVQGMHILPSVGLIGITTFVISAIGVVIGKKSGDLLGRKAEIAGGAILILIGLKILIEHLMG